MENFSITGIFHDNDHVRCKKCSNHFIYLVSIAFNFLFTFLIWILYYYCIHLFPFEFCTDLFHKFLIDDGFLHLLNASILIPTVSTSIAKILHNYSKWESLRLSHQYFELDRVGIEPLDLNNIQSLGKWHNRFRLFCKINKQI